MTSSVFSLLFLLVVFPSITAMSPTGLKIRISDRALDALKNIGLKLVEQLVNKPFPDFAAPCGCQKCSIKGFTITNLIVDPVQVVLGLQEKSGLQLEISNLHFSGQFQQEISLYLFKEITDTGMVTFEGKNVGSTIGVKLNHNQQGRLNVEMANCEVTGEFIATGSGPIVGPLWEFLSLLGHDFLNTKLCPALQMIVMPIINDMLEGHAMMLHKVLNITFLNHVIPDVSIDLSLTEDISVSSCSLDVSLKGLVWQGDSVEIPPVIQGAELVFGENRMMAYVGISEFFFNSAATSLFRLGPFQFNLPQGPVEVKFTDAPIVSISKSGLCVDVNLTAQSLTDSSQPPVAANCQLYLKMEFKGNRVALVLKDTKCKVQPETSKGNVVKPLVNFFFNCKTTGFLKSWFDEGVQIPLPEGVYFTKGKIYYHNGFMVVGGNLDFPLGV